MRTLLSLLLMLSPAVAYARTWHILNDGSGDAPTIQAGIDSTAQGDTVLVGPGTYYERLRISGKNVSLLGSGPEKTAISGLGYADSLSILVLDNLDTTTVVSGLTFQDGGQDSSVAGGGAIYCFSSSVKIQGNVFTRNLASNGGAILVDTFGHGPLILDNEFVFNYAREAGGAIEVFWADSTLISNNRFESNVALGTSGYVGVGGAIGVFFSGDIQARSNVFLRNRAAYGGAISIEWGSAIIDNNSMALNYGIPAYSQSTIRVYSSFSSLKLTNNIISFTTSGVGLLGVGTPGGVPQIALQCNDFWGNELGNYSWVAMESVSTAWDFSADPLFCDLAGDLTLAVSSPCLPQNNPTCGPVGASGLGCDIVPVELLYMKAGWEGGVATLSWETSDGFGRWFDVFREEHETRTRLSLSPLAGGPAFQFHDVTAPESGARYWLLELDRSGQGSWHGPIFLGPRDHHPLLVLGPARPNPFSSSLSIPFTLGAPGPMDIKIFDISGRLIRTLLDEEGQAPGTYTVSWDGRLQDGTRSGIGIFLLQMKSPFGRHIEKLIHLAP